MSVHSHGVSRYGMAKAKVYHKSYTEKDLVYAANCFSVKYGTLHNHWLSLSHPAHKSQTAQQYLTDAEEDSLCEWIAHQSTLLKNSHA